MKTPINWIPSIKNYPLPEKIAPHDRGAIFFFDPEKIQQSYIQKLIFRIPTGDSPKIACFF